jgi:hypothetical protein
MRKLMLFAVLVGMALFTSPAFAQVEFSDESTKYGIVKEIQVQNAGVSESAGKGIIDVTSLVVPDDEVVWTIDGTTGTSTASVSTDTSTATASKMGALKITYPNVSGGTSTGWIRIWSTDR